MYDPLPPTNDKDVQVEMIDRIRQDIQERLDQLLAEADRLRQALTALGGERSQPATRRARTASPSSSAARSRSAGTTRTPSASGSGARTRSRPTSSGSSRASAGGTKNAVLKALADAKGKAMTASEVASATGLGRASVSTTLSKLARSGDVSKADRGYRLGGSSATSNGASESASESAASQA